MTDSRSSGNARSMDILPWPDIGTGKACIISGRKRDARGLTVWLSGPVAVDHPDVAQIDRQRQALADHQRPGLLVDHVGEAEEAADQAAIPEGDRNHAVAFLLGA